jgi:hypothetical protein
MEPGHEDLAHFTAAFAVSDRDVALVRSYAIGAMVLATLMVLASAVACIRCAMPAAAIATRGAALG